MLTILTVFLFGLSDPTPAHATENFGASIVSAMDRVFTPPTAQEREKEVQDCLASQIELYESMKRYKPENEPDFTDDFTAIKKRLSQVAYNYETDVLMLDTDFDKLKTKLTDVYEKEMKGDFKTATPPQKLRYQEITREITENRTRAAGLRANLKQVAIERDAYERILKAGAIKPTAFPEHLIAVAGKVAKLQKNQIPIQIAFEDQMKNMPEFPRDYWDPEAMAEFKEESKKYRETIAPLQQEIQRLQEDIRSLTIEQQVLMTAMTYESGGLLMDPNAVIQMFGSDATSGFGGGFAVVGGGMGGGFGFSGASGGCGTVGTNGMGHPSSPGLGCF